MSASSVITEGFGAPGSSSLVITEGFGQGAAPFVPPVVTAQTPAGRSKKHRFIVEIDGHDFFVNSPEEAVVLLKQAKELAKETAPEIVRQEVRRIKQGIESKSSPIPSVLVKGAPDEFAEMAERYMSQIREVYQDAALAEQKRMAVIAEAQAKNLAELELLAAQIQEEDEFLHMIFMSEQ